MNNTNNTLLDKTATGEASACTNTSCCPPAQGTIKREQPKVGRNEPCPCGSERKFKKCCGKNI